MNFTILSMKISDYTEVITLWKNAGGGVRTGQSDERPEITRFLERNPGLSMVARAADGALAGAVLCGHDGRRGYLHHLAVHPDYHRQGVGQQLVKACLDALAQAGIRKCHCFVIADYLPAVHFWKSRGWKQRLDLTVMSVDIPG